MNLTLHPPPKFHIYVIACVWLVYFVQCPQIPSVFLKMEGFPSFSWLVNIPLSMCVWLFIHSSFDRHLGCFYKEPSCQVGDIRDKCSIPGSGRSPGGGHSNPVFLLDNPMDRGVWQAAVHRVAQSWARGPYKASLRTKLAEVMELQWSCFQS